MFGFFSSRKNKPQATASQTARAASGTGSRLGTQQHTDIQRELVRVVLKDLLRAHGIPGNWLGCEVLVMPGRKSDDEVTVQLQVLHWNEMLLRHAQALEHALLKGLDRFDPLVDHSRYHYTWQFAPNCGCPYKELPAKLAWAQSATATGAMATPPASILDRRQRPRAPKGSRADGFPRTEMSALDE